MTMGRPLIEIDQETFEGLCKIQCTLNEIACVFNCSEDTVQRWCQRTYESTFADAHKKHSQEGKASIRRLQYKSANGGNVTMQIWLGKQYLGQRDKQEIEHSGNFADLLLDANKQYKEGERSDPELDVQREEIRH